MEWGRGGWREHRAAGRCAPLPSPSPPKPFPSPSTSPLLAPCSLPQAGAEGSRQLHGPFLLPALPTTSSHSRGWKVSKDEGCLNSSLMLIQILDLETFLLPLASHCALRSKFFKAREVQLTHSHCPTPFIDTHKADAVPILQAKQDHDLRQGHGSQGPPYPGGMRAALMAQGYRRGLAPRAGCILGVQGPSPWLPAKERLAECCIWR